MPANEPSTDDLIAQHQASLASTDDLIKAHQQQTAALAPKRPQTPIGEAIILGGDQGLSQTYGDEAYGLYSAVKGKLKGSPAPAVELYRAGRDAQRAQNDAALQDWPITYHTAEAFGSLGTSLLGGKVAKAIGMGAEAAGPVVEAVASKVPQYLQTLKDYATTAGKVMTGGAVQGVGAGNADLTQGDYAGAVDDAERGAGTAALVHGGISAAGAGVRQIKNLPAKLANVFLNTPEELTQTYINNPVGVKTARKPFEVAQDVGKSIEDLKKEAIAGSAESRAALDAEGLQYNGSDIAVIPKQIADDLESRVANIKDNTQRAAALAYLRYVQKELSPVKQKAAESRFVDQYGNQLPAEQAPAKEKIVTGSRLKDMIQTLDDITKFDPGTGQITQIDDQIQQQLRAAYDAKLKGDSPAYEKLMDGVAKDTKLLVKMRDFVPTDSRAVGVYHRANVDQNGAGQLPVATLQAFDERMGTDYQNQFKLAEAKAAFDKSVTNGSQNVQKFSRILEKVPVVGPALGATLGATVDKYGRKITMDAVDTAQWLNDLYKNSPLPQYKAALQPLIDQAKKGNPAATATLGVLTHINARAVDDFYQQDAMQRRMGQ